jgi:aminomethyltransferase
MAQTDAAQALRRTPLYAMHVRLGARMVPFAGYDMPVQYRGGIIAEHLHTRGAASLFDVSHMGQIALRPRSGRGEDAARALEALVPGDIIGLAPGRQRYTLFTDAAGGVLDDLMVSNQRDQLMLVVNAACKEADEAHLRAHLSDTCHIEPLSPTARWWRCRGRRRRRRWRASRRRCLHSGSWTPVRLRWWMCPA